MKKAMDIPTSPSPPAKPKKRKTSHEPRHLDHDERFYDLFKCALHGLCGQFEDPSSDDIYPRYVEGKAELERCQDLCRRAWNVAVYATAMFEDDEPAMKEFTEVEDEVDAFNAAIEAEDK
jgi:hypothetical protein